jgi:hypothetical protein
VGVVAAPLGVGFDVVAVDADGWGAEEPGPLGGLLVGDRAGVDLGIDAEVGLNLLDQGQRRREVRALLGVEHLDQRPPGCHGHAGRLLTCCRSAARPARTRAVVPATSIGRRLLGCSLVCVIAVVMTFGWSVAVASSGPGGAGGRRPARPFRSPQPG